MHIRAYPRVRVSSPACVLMRGASQDFVARLNLAGPRDFLLQAPAQPDRAVETSGR